MKIEIQRIKNGDCRMVDQMIDFYYPQIYKFVYRTLCGKEQAKDITQEVFIHFLDHLDRYPDDLAIRPYLFQIAINLCRDYFRAQKRREQESELYDQFVDDQDTPHESSMKKERGERIKAALAHLPFEQRTAILLRYYHQLKFKEIAELVEVSESTIKSRISLGMEKLKKELQEDASWMIG